MQEINIQLFQFLNAFSSHHIIVKIVSIFSDLPIFFLPIFLLYTWISYTYWNKNTSKKPTLLFIFYSCIVAVIFSIIVQQFVNIERPETAITGAGRLLLDHIPDASFPSDHASVSVAFLSALFLTGYKKIFWSFLPWVILMLLSRVIAGVHWPFDILAGSVVGILAAYISTLQLVKIKFVKKLNSFIIQALTYIKL